MAAVTVTNRVDTVFGDRRVIMANIQVATTGDTWVTGLTNIDTVQATPSTAISSGVTFSGGTVTFAQAADALIKVLVIGQ